MIERDASGFGKVELTATPFEQRVAEPFFEPADLHRKCRLRNVQALSSAGKIAIMGDCPKITEMLEIKVGHSFC